MGFGFRRTLHHLTESPGHFARLGSGGSVFSTGGNYWPKPDSFRVHGNRAERHLVFTDILNPALNAPREKMSGES